MTARTPSERRQDRMREIIRLMEQPMPGALRLDLAAEATELADMDWRCADLWRSA